jgi:hypothetical protein
LKIISSCIAELSLQAFSLVWREYLLCHTSWFARYGGDDRADCFDGGVCILGERDFPFFVKPCLTIFSLPQW